MVREVAPAPRELTPTPALPSLPRRGLHGATPIPGPRSLAAKVAPGITRRAALAFVGAGAGFGIAAADKLWREGWPAVATGPTLVEQDRDEFVALEESKPQTLEWAFAIQAAPDDRLLAESDTFARTILRDPSHPSLLVGCRRLIELTLAGRSKDPDMALSTIIQAAVALKARHWLPHIKTRIPNPSAFSRSIRLINRTLARPG